MMDPENDPYQADLTYQEQNDVDWAAYEAMEAEVEDSLSYEDWENRRWGRDD